MALVKIDRDLRLAEVMSSDPPWLKWFAGAEEVADSKRGAITVLEKLIKDQSITPAGMEAYCVLKSDELGKPIRQVMNELLQGRDVSDFDHTSRLLASHRGTWWQARLIEDWEKTTRPTQYWRQTFGQDSAKIRTRAIFARSAVWLTALAGLAFIAPTLRQLRRAFSDKPAGYGSRWTVHLGLVVFLVATLAWIGFTLALEIGITALPGLHPAMAILLDSTARLLPSFIAVGLLFRKPAHATRVLGLQRRPCLSCILGLFALLMILDQILRALFDNGSGPDPGGGLSVSESGWWGLAFSLVSACLLAPFAEEMLYRGVLFKSLRNHLGMLAAAIISSIVFAILHFYDGYGLASVGVFGLSCALLYAATGSLWSCIALHVLYNSSIKIPEWIVYHAPF